MYEAARRIVQRNRSRYGRKTFQLPWNGDVSIPRGTNGREMPKGTVERGRKGQTVEYKVKGSLKKPGSKIKNLDCR